MRKFKPLRPHIPETLKLTKSNLKYLIKKYSQVILKPVGGSRGSGVVKVSSKGNKRYKIYYEKTRTTVNGKGLDNYINQIVRFHSYLVQRRINLAKINSRLFDIRVIVQRKKDSDSWRVTGQIAKVAGKGYIVTNIKRSKGTILPVETAIDQSSLKGFSIQTLLSNINKVSLLLAKKLSSLYPGHRVYGLDMGLDHNGHVWIIEANLYPLMSHFLKLKNETMYRQIMEYAEIPESEWPKMQLGLKYY
jgi:glutathione synthase/RimK-type ligase-like ATP-grasp enzyme